MTDFRWPNPDEHCAIVGRNGTGKSQFGAYVLAKRDLKNSRTIVLDYKGEELFNSIERIREIDVYGALPKHNGLYILRVHPGMNEAVEKFLWKIWEKENTGLFVDEGYMIPSSEGGAFQALLTQGRSKRTPVITLSQRPVKVSRFAFSESSHIALFHLNDKRDQKTIAESLPEGFVDWVPSEFRGVDSDRDLGNRLPKYHARWYNVKDDAKFVLKPVPEADQIVAEIDAQLEPKQRWL